MAPMGKPRKKAAAALAARPAMRALKGKAGKKRAAEDKIEQAVSAKKKKVVPPAKPVLPAKEAGAEASKQRPPKEEETSSSVDEEESNSESEEESNSDSEEEAAQSEEEESNDDNSATNSESNEAAQSMEEESNDDNSAMNSESNEDTTPSTILKTEEKDSSNDEEDAEDDNNEESDGEDENSQSNEEDDNSESGEEDENSESSEHDEDPTPKKEAPGSTSEEQDATKEPKTPVSNLSQGKVSKTLFVGNAPFKADIDHIKLFFKEAGSVINVRFPINKDGRRKGVCYVDFESVEAAQKAIELNGREFMSRKVRLDFAFPKVSQESNKKDDNNEESNKKDDNNEESGEQDDSNEESGEEQNATKEPKTPVSTQDQATVSKTLFMGNAPFKADVDQVQHFFKDAGLVIDVRFPLNEDGRRKGFCYVEFASVEAAQKAIELNGREFMSRQVRLDFALEIGSRTPQDGNETGSVQKPAKGSSLSIFVKGFDKSLGEDKIRSSLEQHFAECGEITRVSIPSDNNTGVIKGIAYMDFKEQESVSKALKLNGSDLGGRELVVDNATPKVDRSGGRRGGGRSGGRGRFGGRNSGRGGRGGRK